MSSKLVHVSILVNDYDEAIEFFVSKLGFELITDVPAGPMKRWVVVKPPGEGECSILLAKATGDEQKKAVGNQSGGRVFLFLHTDNFSGYFARLKENGVKIVREPSNEPYGIVAVFEDLYGNKWDLIEPAFL